MARTRIFALTLVLMLGGCSRDAFARQTAAELDALTDAMIAAVEAHEDERVGVARARALLDEGRVELEPRWREVRSLSGLRLSDAAAAEIAATVEADVAKLARLRIELMLATAADPELAAAVDELLASYAALIDGE